MSTDATDISLEPTVYHRIVSAQDSHTNLFTITFNRPVHPNNIAVVIHGDLSSLFTVDVSSRNVSAVGTLQVGRYELNIVISGIPQETAPTGYALVEVTPQRKWMFKL